MSIIKKFKEQVEQSQNSIAVYDNVSEYTYVQLDNISSLIAEELNNQGVQEDDIVGIYMDRSSVLLIMILAIIKSGASYMPLDSIYPKERIRYMLENAKCKNIIVDKKLEYLEGINVFFTDKLINGAEQNKKNMSYDKSNARSSLYNIYTSGSTGKPKGVAVPHSALSNHMEWMINAFSFSSSDIIFQKTPYSFDASVWEFYLPILTGGKLYMAIPSGHMDPYYLIDEIIKEDITVLQIVPSMLKLLVDIPEFIKCKSLRYIFSGGEVLTKNIVNEVLSKLPQIELINLYGPTEACIDSSYWKCNLYDERVPIGKPIKNAELYVLDENMNETNMGELYISGPGLALGYINNKKETNNKFKEVYLNGKLKRMYKTGDLVSNENNVFYFHGRIDNQLNINGHRIEAGEIEKIAEQILGIQKAVVISIEDNNGNNVLAMYYTLLNNYQLKTSIIKESMLQILPSYMVPILFYEVDNFPVLPNGKIDRRNIIGIQSERQETMMESRNDNVEDLIKQEWRKALGIETLTKDDDFFNIGGHSLLAYQIINSLRVQHGIKLDFSYFLKNSNLNDFINNLSQYSDNLNDEFDYEEYEAIQKFIAKEGKNNEFQ